MTKRQRRRRAARSRSGAQITTLLMVGMATVAVIVGLFLLLDSGDGNSPGAPVDNALLVTGDAWQTGDAAAPVTVVEFLDFECEACRAAHPVVQKILQDYEGRINYVMRNFPNHNNSVLAAKAAEAAGEQGMYWEMYDKLFETQGEWGEKQKPQTEAFIRYAGQFGLDVDAFTASLNSNDYTDKIRQDREDGIAAGVTATPTFFINGEKVAGVMSYATFAGKIEEELGS